MRLQRRPESPRVPAGWAIALVVVAGFAAGWWALSPTMGSKLASPGEPGVVRPTDQVGPEGVSRKEPELPLATNGSDIAGSEPLTSTAAPLARLSGVVVDLLGVGVAGAEVRGVIGVPLSDDQGHPLFASTSADGSFTLEGRAGLPLTDVLATGPGSVRGALGRAVVLGQAQSEHLTIVVHPALSLSGQVVWLGGDEAVGATVSVESFDRSPARAPLEPASSVVEAVSDALGQFHAEDVVGPWIRLSAALGGASSLHPWVGRVGARTEVTGMSVEVAYAHDLHGRVVDETGRGWAGATVSATPLEAALPVSPIVGIAPQPRPRTETTTDTTGRFSLQGLTEGSWRISTRPAGSGHASTRVEVRRESPPEEVILTLAGQHVLVGSVLGPDGAGVAGAEVLLPYSGQATTDEGGSFRMAFLDRPPQGHVLAWAPGFSVQAVPVREGDPHAPVTIHLVPAAGLTMQVMSAHGTPIAGAMVRAISSNVLDGTQPDLHGPKTWERLMGLHEAPTDGEGMVTLPALASGRHEVRVWHDDLPWVQSSVTVEVDGDGPKRLTIADSPDAATSLRLSVRSSAGDPVRAFQVALGDERLGPTRVLAPPAWWIGSNSARYTGLVPGPRLIQISAPGFAVWSDEVRLDQGEQSLAVVLRPAATLSVTVVRPDGTPVEGARLSVSQSDRPLALATPRTDGHGEATVHGVPVGPARITAWKPRTPHPFERTKERATASRMVTLVPDDHHHVEIILDPPEPRTRSVAVLFEMEAGSSLDRDVRVAITSDSGEVLGRATIGPPVDDSYPFLVESSTSFRSEGSSTGSLIYLPVADQPLTLRIQAEGLAAPDLVAPPADRAAEVYRILLSPE